MNQCLWEELNQKFEGFLWQINHTHGNANYTWQGSSNIRFLSLFAIGNIKGLFEV